MPSVRKNNLCEFEVPKIRKKLFLPSKNPKARRRLKRTVSNLTREYRHSRRRLRKYLLSLIPKSDYPIETKTKPENRLVHVTLSVQSSHVVESQGRRALARDNLSRTSKVSQGVPAQLVKASMPIKLLKRQIKERKIKFNTKCLTWATRALHWGVEFGQSDLIKRMLESGAKVDGFNERGRTPLQEAIQRGRGVSHFPFNINCNKEVVMLLLEAGADFNITNDSGRTLLHLSIEQKLDDIMQWLLVRGAKVNVVTDDGETPLSIAAGLAKVDLVESLLGLGAEVNLAKGGQHALFEALYGRVGTFGPEKQEDRQKVALSLISHGADINCQDNKTGCTILEFSLKQNQAMVALELINRGADITQPVKGSSLLHLAITMKGSEELCLEIVNALFNQGYNVDFNALDSDGKSPLHMSSREGYFTVSKFLVSKGLSVNVNASDRHHTVPLDHAVTSKNVELVKLLLDAGAHVDGNKHEPLCTPLHKTLDGGNFSWEIITLLLEHGATNMRRKLTDYTSCLTLSVLDRAIENRKVELVILLRSHGFKYSPDSLVEACETLQIGLAKYLIERNFTSKISTALYQVVLRMTRSWNLDMLEKMKGLSSLLLDHGADVNHRFSKYSGGVPGKTMLEHLVENGCNDIAMHFISIGADIFSTHNYAHHSGQTLIHMIANDSSRPPRTPCLDLVQCLHHRGLDIMQPNSNGKTPLHLAAKRGYLELVQYLVLNGSSVNAKDFRGNTPLHFAVKNKDNKEVVKFLLQKGAQQVRNKSGKTPAFFMCKNNDYSFASLLVIRGQTDYGMIRDDHWPIWYSGLYFAAKSCFSEIERYDEITLEDKQELFGVAAVREDMETLKAIKNQISVEPSMMTNALLALIRVGKPFVNHMNRPRMEKELVQGIPLSMMKRSVDGSTILSQACLHNREGLVKIILKNYYPEQLVTLGTPSPIWIAANEGFRGILEELVQHCDNPGEELTRQCVDGTSPLVMAVVRGHKNVMDIFRKHCCKKLVLRTIIEFRANDLITDYGLDTLRCILRHGVSSENSDALKFAVSLNLLPLEITGPHPTSLEILDILKLECSEKISDLTLLSNQYPAFNDEIDSFSFKETLSRIKENQNAVMHYQEEQLKKRSTKPDLSMGEGLSRRFGSQIKGYVPLQDPNMPSHHLDITKDIISNVLRPFCCLKTAIESNSDMLELKEIAKIMDICAVNCTQKEECEKVSALLTACHLLEDEIRSQEMAWLKPTFVLIGSVAEGTRLEKANEIDLTVMFQDLEEYPMSPSKYNLGLHLPNGSPMLRFSKDNDEYDHVSFLSYLLDATKSGLARATKSPEWPQSLLCNLGQWQPCAECIKFTNTKRKSIYSPQFHCQNCLPSVAHTKVGPCLLFSWKGNITLTADLVPVFPVISQSGGVLGLFNTVTQSLLKTKPENWLQHFKSVIERDSILPESLGRVVTTSSGQTAHQVAIKLLNYSPKDNCVIRPGQGLNTIDLRVSGPLRDIYTCIKVVRELCQAKVKSYVIKKVILSPDIKLKLEESNIHTNEATFVALSHPELKKHFGKINFKQWERNIHIMHKSHRWTRDNQIPMLDRP